MSRAASSASEKLLSTLNSRIDDNKDYVDTRESLIRKYVDSKDEQINWNINDTSKHIHYRIDEEVHTLNDRIT